MSEISDAELACYMDEALGPEDMARVEKGLRDDEELNRRFTLLRQARDKGWHSVGAIWRAHSLSCPTRSQLGSYLLDALDPHWQEYIQFHIAQVGCRICAANLDDLRERHESSSPAAAERRRRFFQSSIGRLSSD